MSTPVNRSLEGPSTSGSSVLIRGHVNKHLKYRDLQKVAKEHNIPCNLKKETMRIAIEARLNGNEELLNAILKNIKEERLLRKRVVKQCNELNELNQHHSKSHYQMNDKSTFSIRDLLLEKMVNQTSYNNVRIRKTEVKAEYRSYNPSISTDYTISSSSYYSPSSVNNTGTPQWPLPSVLSTGNSILRSYMTPSIYSNNMMNPDTMSVSSCTPKQYGDIPQQISRNNHITRYPYYHEQPREENTHINTTLEGIQIQEPFVDYTTKPNLLPLESDPIPPFDTLMKNRTKAMYNSTSSMVGQESVGHVNQSNQISLNYLAEMATMLDKDSQYLNRIVNEAPNINNCCINRSELIADDSKSTSETIPTWNNFLEQCTSKSVARGTKCKYGCQTVGMSSDKQLEHEVNCFLQPLVCPAVGCQWVQQLGSLSTHIFTYHNNHVRASPVATYELDYGNDHSFNMVFGPNPEEGPRRDTFFQFVNHRLFVVLAIGNFKNMQMCIYVQYVNDIYEYVSSAVIEIIRPDGIPFQWAGKVLPMTYSPTRIISKGHGLIFNMNAIPRVQTFTIHIKIRNHKLVPVT